MSVLRISLFGTFRLVHENDSFEPKLAPKTQALLAYLLVQGLRLHSREVLLDVFWGDQELEQARSCLSTTLWRLRRALEPTLVSPGAYLITRPTGEVGFNWHSDHWIDVAIFEAQVKRILACPVITLQDTDIHLLEEALQLYTGDLLEGLYEDWAIREQERLRSLYLNCLEHLMHYYRQFGVYARSLAYGQQILQREPLHEEIHREVMQLYLESGQRAQAVQQYEICREILARELKLAPMPETQALYHQAINTANQATIGIQRADLESALKQLSLATRDFDKAHQQFKQASQKFEQAHQQMQRVLKLIERCAFK